MAAAYEFRLHKCRVGGRVIGYAVAASLALHALALFMLSQFGKPGPRRNEPMTLAARLVPIKRAPEPARVAPEPLASATAPVPHPMPAHSSPSRPASHARAALSQARPPEPAAPPRPAGIASPAPPSAVAPVAKAASEALASLGSALVAAGPAPAPARVQMAENAAAVSPEAVALGQYRVAIISAAQRYRMYPRIAIDNGWEGRVDIRLGIDARGELASIDVQRTSRYKVLDQSARDMIFRARPSAPVPAALRGRAFAVDLPVMFSLKDELR